MKMRIRNIMIGFCVFIGTIITGITAYRAGEMVEKKLDIASEEIVSAEETTMNEAEDADYYTARLEGDVLAVYVHSGEREVFMYTLDVRVEDISEGEKNRLKEGIVLENKQELASFEEDFTS